jgi:hypothetical protein
MDRRRDRVTGTRSGRFTFASWPIRFGELFDPEEAGDRGRNYATTTTMFPSFWPDSAYL